MTTGQELERAPRITSLPDKIEYAKALAASDLLPRSYRGAPANVLVAVEYGASLDLPPMTAIQGVHVIEGKPSLSADLMAALVRRAGHKLRVGFHRSDEKGKSYGWAELIRSDDPDFTYRCEWSWSRANRAKVKTKRGIIQLTEKDNWQNWPEAMMKARAVTEVIREGASEVLHGMIYSPDELGFTTDVSGNPIVEGEIVQNVDAEPQRESAPSRHGEPEPEPVRKRDLTALHAAFGDLGVGKDDKHTYASSVIGREITSTKDLTRDEADKVIAQVRADINARSDKNAASEPVEAELVEDGAEFEDEAWKRGEDPRLYDSANDGALDAQMEAGTDG